MDKTSSILAGYVLELFYLTIILYKVYWYTLRFTFVPKQSIKCADPDMEEKNDLICKEKRILEQKFDIIQFKNDNKNNYTKYILLLF